MIKLQRPRIWQILHGFIIMNFVIQIAYAASMVFFVVTGDTGSGPLFGGAAQLPFELMMTRRMYASECWIAISGLAIYLAITEIYPRTQRPRD